MNPWEQGPWQPDGQTVTVVSQYELLCREAEALDLGIELRLDGELHDIRLSNGASVGLLDITCLEAASAELRRQLDREMG